MKHLYTPPVTTRIGYCLPSLLVTSPQYDNVLNTAGDDENTPDIFDYGNKGNVEDARAKGNEDLWE